MALLGAQDPAAVTLFNENAKSPILLLADHASNTIPRRLNNLGLQDDILHLHVAYDIGTRTLVKKLASLLDATAIISGYSRLVVDLNRNLLDESAMPHVSDNILIPGNQQMRPEERQQRIDEIYTPYREMIESRLAQFKARDTVPAFISIHSFTPEMDGMQRPWHIGLLWDKDPRLPLPLLELLRAHPDELVVGDNEPYSGKHPADYTIDHHAEAARIPHVSIEIRQDLLLDEAGIDYWAKLLSASFQQILEDPSIHTLLDT